MKKFTLFWLHGKSEIIEGDSIQNAFMLAGYSGGAIQALDFHAKGDVTNKWKWDKTNRDWIENK